MSYFRYTIDKKLHDHEQSIITINTDLTTAIGNITGLTTRVAGCEATDVIQTQTIQSMQGTISAQTTAINQLLARMSSLEDRVTALEQQIN
jgi:uncharacterized coiled-coil protein SlyX